LPVGGAVPGSHAAAMTISNPAIRLTRRETQIVDALLTAAPNKIIADQLGLREQSVKNRLSRLYRKAGVSNRLELLLLVMRNAPDQLISGNQALNGTR